MTPEQKRLFDELTPLNQAFATCVLSGCYTNREAYVKAGGKAKTAESQDSSASRMLSDVKVQAFLSAMKEEAVTEAVMARREALERLSRIGRGSISKVVSFSKISAGVDEDGDPVSQSVWELKDAKEMTEHDMELISELNATRDGFKFKIHSAVDAIAQLRKMEGWDKEPEHDNPDEETVDSVEYQIVDASKANSQ